MDISQAAGIAGNHSSTKSTFDIWGGTRIFNIGRRVMLHNARQYKELLGKERISCSAIEDVTER